MGKTDNFTENYEMLASAIIELAVRDYVKALETKVTDKFTSYDEWYLNEETIAELEKFFTSKQFDIYSRHNLDGKYVIKQIKQQVGAA